jgi:hypothetical protein
MSTSWYTLFSAALTMACGPHTAEVARVTFEEISRRVYDHSEPVFAESEKAYIRAEYQKVWGLFSAATGLTEHDWRQLDQLGSEITRKLSLSTLKDALSELSGRVASTCPPDFPHGVETELHVHAQVVRHAVDPEKNMVVVSTRNSYSQEEMSLAQEAVARDVRAGVLHLTSKPDLVVVNVWTQ